MDESSWDSVMHSPMAKMNIDQIEDEEESSSRVKQNESRTSSYNEVDNYDFPQDIKTKKIQLILWLSMLENDLDSVYQLWFRKFDIFQKVALWNSLGFFDEYFKNNGKSKMIF